MGVSIYSLVWQRDHYNIFYHRGSKSWCTEKSGSCAGRRCRFSPFHCTCQPSVLCELLSRKNGLRVHIWTVMTLPDFISFRNWLWPTKKLLTYPYSGWPELFHWSIWHSLKNIIPGWCEKEEWGNLWILSFFQDTNPQTTMSPLNISHQLKISMERPTHIGILQDQILFFSLIVWLNTVQHFGLHLLKITQNRLWHNWTGSFRAIWQYFGTNASTGFRCWAGRWNGSLAACSFRQIFFPPLATWQGVYLGLSSSTFTPYLWWKKPGECLCMESGKGQWGN